MQRYSPGSKYKPILIKDMEIEKESEKNVLYEGPMNLDLWLRIAIYFHWQKLVLQSLH